MTQKIINPRQNQLMQLNNQHPKNLIKPNQVFSDRRREGSGKP